MDYGSRKISTRLGVAMALFVSVPLAAAPAVAQTKSVRESDKPSIRDTRKSGLRDWRKTVVSENGG